MHVSAIVVLSRPIIGNNCTKAYAHSVCTFLPYGRIKRGSFSFLGELDFGMTEHGHETGFMQAPPSEHHFKQGCVTYNSTILFQVSCCSSSAAFAALNQALEHAPSRVRLVNAVLSLQPTSWKPRSGPGHTAPSSHVH